MLFKDIPRGCHIGLDNFYLNRFRLALIFLNILKNDIGLVIVKIKQIHISLYNTALITAVHPIEFSVDDQGRRTKTSLVISSHSLYEGRTG